MYSLIKKILFIPIIIMIMLMCSVVQGAYRINTLKVEVDSEPVITDIIPLNKYPFPLTTQKITEILKIPKGMRPNPNTYLPKAYIEDHLLQFQNGITIIMGLDSYKKYVVPTELIGREDNTCFVMPSYICDEIDQIANNDISVYERMLSFTTGYFSKQHGLVRLDITDLRDLNLRMPSGNELGANEYWIPGGYTIGGIPEAITNLIPKYRMKISIYK